MSLRMLAAELLSLMFLVACDRSISSQPATTSAAAVNSERTDKVIKTNEQWKKELTPQQYHVLREKGTERAFSGSLWDNHEPGVYKCAACALELFDAETKFESGTGWPSFYAPAGDDRVSKESDTTHGMTRDEIVCARCGGHLGHVFDDGPKPTGLRYCMNSAALTFEAREKAKQ